MTFPKHLLISVAVSIVLCSSNWSAGQEQGGTISGQIVDSESGDGVPYVNVFLSNTTLGAASDQHGHFVIHHIPQGVYDLVFDCIGYKTQSMEVRMLQSQSLRYKIKLQPRIYNTENILVIAEKPEQWLHNLDIFIREFIGSGIHAAKCSILNPEVLNLDQDPDTGTMFAHTDSILRIRNDALGYQIDVRLVQFTFNFKNNICRYEIYPRFFEQIPGSEAQKNIWEDNRRQSFTGSLKHFLYLFVRKRYFPLYKIYILIGNREKSRVSSDILHMEHIPNSSLMRISFPDLLGFDYYSFGIPQLSSQLRLDRGYAYIDTLGNIYGPITKRGDWSKERVADLLPYDYKWER